VPLTAVPG
jgi:hypothetical protein